MTRFEGIDWERLWKRLFVAARYAAARAPDVFDGISVKDLVQETLAEFFASTDGLGWKASKGPLDKYLVGVLRKKAKMRLRRQRYMAGSFDDPESRLAEPSQPEAVSAGLEFRSVRDRLLELVGNDRELRDLIAAVELTTGSHNVNQEFATILDCTPQHVVNLKRRFLNVPGVMEAMYGQGRTAKQDVSR